MRPTVAGAIFDRPVFDATATWRTLSPDTQEMLGALALELRLARLAVDRAVTSDGDCAAARPYLAALRKLDVKLGEVCGAVPSFATDPLPLPGITGPVCAACGCTWDDACPPSCAWASPSREERIANPNTCTSCSAERAPFPLFPAHPEHLMSAQRDQDLVSALRELRNVEPKARQTVGLLNRARAALDRLERAVLAQLNKRVA
jgi:hypothetical protein